MKLNKIKSWRTAPLGWNTRKAARCPDCDGSCAVDDINDLAGDADGYGSLADVYLAEPADAERIVDFDADLKAHPHSVGLAMRMHDWLSAWGDKAEVPDHLLLADALEDALWHAARGLQQGRTELYLDQIGTVSMWPDGPQMRFDPDLTRDEAVKTTADLGPVLSFDTMADGGVAMSTGRGERLVLSRAQVGAAARCLLAMAEAREQGPGQDPFTADPRDQIDERRGRLALQEQRMRAALNRAREAGL